MNDKFLNKVRINELNPGSFLIVSDFNDTDISNVGLNAQRSFIVILSKIICNKENIDTTGDYYDIKYLCFNVYFSCNLIVGTRFFVAEQENYHNFEVFTYNGILLD